MNRSAYALLAVVAAAAAVGAYWLGRMHSAAPDAAMTVGSPAAEPTEQREILFYRNPMNPSITSPVPARDEMGMDYVPVYADGGGSRVEPGTVSIDPAIEQNMGVRTASAERQDLAREIRTVGRVDYDEDGLVRVHLRSEGWVERLLVKETGQPVRRGEPLLILYSPQIVSTEQEYLLALRGLADLRKDAPPEFVDRARALSESSAERLRLLGVPESELKRLRADGEIQRAITLTSPASGIIQFVGVREGQFVTAQTETYRIADLSTVWVLADLYEDELPWVRPGDHAVIRLHGLPEDSFEASIDYIYPYLEGDTRTQKVRLRLPNPGRELKPDMYADVTFHVQPEVDAVAVPESAIVRSGTRAQVFVRTAPGRFEPREVRLGVAARGLVQILEGVAVGDDVVTSAQFLIDSESKLREAAAKLLPPAGAGDGTDDSGEHDDAERHQH